MSALQKLAPLGRALGLGARRAGQQSRGFAADAHGEVKYNCWEKPTQVALWKEEHIVFVVLGGWAAAIYSATKIFGGKKEAPPAAEAA